MSHWDPLVTKQHVFKGGRSYSSADLHLNRNTAPGRGRRSSHVGYISSKPFRLAELEDEPTPQQTQHTPQHQRKQRRSLSRSNSTLLTAKHILSSSASSRNRHRQSTSSLARQSESKKKTALKDSKQNKHTASHARIQIINGSRRKTKKNTTRSMNAHMGSRGLKKRVSDERDVLANFNNTSPHASSATAGRAQDDPYGSNPRGRVVFKANTTTAPSKSSQPIKYSRSLSQLSASASTDELLALAYQQHPDEQPGSGKNAKSKPTNSSLTRLNEDRYYLDPERLAQPDQRDLITQNGAYGGHIRDWTPRESMYASDQTYYSKNRSKHAIKERYMVAFKEKPVDYTGISRAEEAKEARRSVEKKQYMQFIKDEEKVRKFQRKWSTSLQSLPPTLSIAEAKAEQARHARLTELKAKWKILRKDVEDYTKVAQLQMSFYDQD